MTVENPALVTWSVLIILALVFLQAITLGVALFYLGRQISSVQAQATRIGALFSQLLEQTDRLLSSAEVVHSKLPESMEKVSSSLSWVNRKIEEVDGLASRNLNLLSGKLSKMNEQADRLLSGFGSAAYRIHRGIIHPVRHLSAALSAIQESVLWLFMKGRQKESDSASADEQIFI